MAHKILPTFDNVLIRRCAPQKVSKGGIILVEDTEQPRMRGEVIAVGPGAALEVPIQFEPGAEVIIGQYTGTEVEIDGEKYLVVKAEQIIAVVAP